ncbi:TIGR03620 family F420-dependent LLM class oxidoreductase [Acrocarpospora catenulata]|uniref:TIGR03620 family F420-dependent LLM class oxidoreductase n=1 Tax=Acrocarpospora catenulata TaxID=2836182 RepID=UPI001BDB08B5|nr:TIGR03620 family F420-dependent LLM class oxidoreductase [Acrocarpospora catenulata]
MTLPVGTWGVWSSGLRLRGEADAVTAAAAFEDAGCSALWLTGGLGNPFPRVTALLRATRTVTVATGILSIWEMSATAVVSELARLAPEHRARFLLGLGVSHSSLVDRDHQGRYARPLSRMREFLDELDASDAEAVGAGRDSRVLAALGPRMLDLASERAAGAHPYLTTPEHTETARKTLGDQAFLAPTQMALLEPDPVQARETARNYLRVYLRQANYVQNWERLGFTPDAAADGGSDRLVDALVAWGDPQQVAARIRSHVEAGADHVCIQILDREARWNDHPLPVEDLRVLLKALG